MRLLLDTAMSEDVLKDVVEVTLVKLGIPILLLCVAVLILILIKKNKKK